MKNRKIAGELRKIADMMEIRGIQWKPRAYRSAARKIENMDESIEDIYNDGGKRGLQDIPSIGESLADHIAEYIEKGRVKKWERTKRGTGGDLPELLKIEGLGPKKVRLLAEKLHIANVGDLEKAAEEGKIRDLEGFGKQTEKNILRSVRQFRESRDRMLIGKAWKIAEETMDYLKSRAEVEKMDYAGSLRRMKETIGDIDILAVTPKPKDLMDVFTDMKDVSRILVKGESKSTVILEDTVHIDLRVIREKSYGAALLYFTGSKDHNIQLRKRALEEDLKLSEYGLFNEGAKKPRAAKEEADIYGALGLAWIPPELRENTEEIEAAEKDALPELVEAGDIRGDLHMHSRYSDGLDSIRDMAKKAKERGYDYIAVTDHSRSERIAHGMQVRDIEKQWKEIDGIGDEEGIHILKGAEVDILEDGSLDYGDDILEQLDLVTAAVHSDFGMKKKKMTARILQALENPCVNVLAHPTGRMINKRDGYEADMDAIFRACASGHVALEINSDPRRLDLNGTLIMAAKKHKVKFSVGTDAHSAGMLGNIRFGLGQARRGWLEKKDLINTRSLAQLRKFLKAGS